MIMGISVQPEGFVPIIGIIVLLYICVVKGIDNTFGEIQSAQLSVKTLIKIPVVVDGRYPAYAADEPDLFHFAIFLNSTNCMASS